MPYMQRITWSGIALHAGAVPGHPASHGCIRLTNDFAIRLWHLTKRGTRVIIAGNDVRPVEIANPHLFAAKTKAPPDPPANLARDGVTTVAATHAPGTNNGAEAQGGTNRQVPDSWPKAALRRVTPISVFVSRKLKRLFVRQGSKRPGED
jgi:hypothetical protein